MLIKKSFLFSKNHPDSGAGLRGEKMGWEGAKKFHGFEA